jgi:hypothetical protein
MTDKCLVIIDSTTGTILSPDRLYAVLATVEQIDEAGENDSDAADLAMRQGVRISRTLLEDIASNP